MLTSKFVENCIQRKLLIRNLNDESKLTVNDLLLEENSRVYNSTVEIEEIDIVNRRAWKIAPKFAHRGSPGVT